MRRTQRCVLLRVTSLRLRGPSLLLCHPVVPRKLATQSSAKRGETRRGSALLLLHNRVPWGFWFLWALAWGDYATVFFKSVLLSSISISNLLSDLPSYLVFAAYPLHKNHPIWRNIPYCKEKIRIIHAYTHHNELSSIWWNQFKNVIKMKVTKY
jgi:hypothetical protein